MNHIIPLFPQTGVYNALYLPLVAFSTCFCFCIDVQTTSKQLGFAVASCSQVCLMTHYRPCPKKAKSGDWVLCTKCSGWYHCECVGVDISQVKDREFTCCSGGPNHL